MTPRNMTLRKATLRQLVGTASAAALVLALSATVALPQSGRTIKIVVPYTPASGPDITSRLMAEAIGRTHGVTVLTENRPGAGTVLGTEQVARAEPDGNTLLTVANSFVINPAVHRGNYTVAGSFEPVCMLAATPMVLVVQASSPYKTLQDFVTAAKAKPGELVLASGGPASSLHIAIEVLKRGAGISTVYVPYGGTAPAINALMGGHVTGVWADYPTVVGQISSGTLRPLVTTSHGRSEALPNVPTLNETGFGKHEADIFYGIMAPAKTPAATLNQLAGWFEQAMQTPEVKPKLAQQGLFPAVKCGAAFGTFMKNLNDDYTRIIQEANIKVQ